MHTYNLDGLTYSDRTACDGIRGHTDIHTAQTKLVTNRIVTEQLEERAEEETEKEIFSTWILRDRILSVLREQKRPMTSLELFSRSYRGRSSAKAHNAFMSALHDALFFHDINEKEGMFATCYEIRKISLKKEISIKRWK